MDRETDIQRNMALRLMRIADTFQRDAALDYPLDRLLTALAALDGELMAENASHPSSRGFSSTALPSTPLPVKPPLRWDE